jgi:hypothetical protein
MRPVIVKGMRGLGDNIFQRPFIRLLARDREVFLYTPWPELYRDLPVSFLHEPTPLRTQRKNIDKQHTAVWAKHPKGQVDVITVSYGSKSLELQNIIGTMEVLFRLPFTKLDLPPFPVYESAKPIAVIRPVTLRKEWLNESRGPLPEYIGQLSETLMDDYHVISVADLQPGAEWLAGGLEPAAHTRLHSGELGVKELLGLVQSAALVVGGVGWIVPAAIAAHKPLFCVLGGNGGHNAPDRITDARMDLSHVGYATPDYFCRCALMQHSCNKHNSKLPRQWATWRQREGL